MLTTLNNGEIETAKKILSMLDGFSYAKAIDIVDAAHDMLKHRAFVQSTTPPFDIDELRQRLSESLDEIKSRYSDAPAQPSTPNDTSSDTSPQTARTG